MKIVQPGVVPGTATYRASCSHCKCVFEFEEHEGKLRHDQREGTSVTIACPSCKRECWTCNKVAEARRAPMPTGGFVAPSEILYVNGSITADKISSVDVAGLVVENGRIRLKRGKA